MTRRFCEWMLRAIAALATGLAAAQTAPVQLVPPAVVYPPLSSSAVRDEASIREEILERQRLHRERMHQIRMELQREMVLTPPPVVPPLVVERRRWRAGEGQVADAPDAPEAAGLRRLSPEERVRLRHDLREAAREMRGRREGGGNGPR